VRSAWIVKIFGALLTSTGVILSFIVVLAVAEVGARVYIHYFVDGKSFFRTNPFITPWITTSDYPPPRYVDGKAYFRHRSTPTPMTKTKDTVRIITMGGSTTANQRAFRQTGKDYALSLESILNNKNDGISYEVLNAGADAYTSAHSIVNLFFRLLEYRPDIILLMHNTNDLTVNYVGDGAISDYGNKYLSSAYLALPLQATSSILGLVNQSRLLTYFNLPGAIRAYNANFMDPTKDISLGLEYFRRNIELITDICKRNGIKLVLITQPRKLTDLSFLGQEHFKAYNDVTRQVAGNGKAQIIDMFNLLGHDPSLFDGEFHFTPAGINKFAEHIADHLNKTGTGGLSQ